MFLHLGENVVVPIKDIIGIFDMETTMYSSDTIQFLRMAEEDGFVERITKNVAKSFVIAEVDKLFLELSKYAKCQVIVAGYYNPFPVLFYNYEENLDFCTPCALRGL